MERNERLKASEIIELQNKKLRALVKHSYDHVTYYHQLFEGAKLTPDDIKTVDDLYKIPISRKDDIRNLSIENLVANNVDLSKCWPGVRTSGTTGIPLTVYFEKDANVIDSELRMYFTQFWNGDKITNRRVIVASAWLHDPPRFIQKLGMLRTKKISPFDHPRIQLEEVKEFGAKTLIAPPSCVVPLAKEALESDFKGLHLSLIFTGGELLHENVRDFIMKTFDANVLDDYGATEVGTISGECLEHRHHIHSDIVLVEVTREGETVSAGEEGEVTVTSLTRYAQPFIRYNLEDYGIMFDDECRCGSHHFLMKLTSGRASDLIHLPDGRVTSAHEVNMLLTLMPDIKQFQVTQETIDKLYVKLVKGQGFKDNMIAEIKRMFNQRLGGLVDIDVVVVDDIPREKSGKFKLFKTNIPTKL